MLPQKPPQPSCSYLPLKLPSIGIQTSSLISESLVGVAVMATRQNGGRPVKAVVVPGGVNDPPSTAWAVVTVACGSDRLERPAQVLAEDGAADRISATKDSDTRARSLKHPFIMACLPKD